MNSGRGVAASIFQCYLGEELRRARENAGLERDDVRVQLDKRITDRTMFAYEKGETSITVYRLIELCRAIGVAADTVFILAMLRAGLDVQTLIVNLHTICDSPRDGLAAIRQWATNCLANDPSGHGVARISIETVSHMALMINWPADELVAFFREAIPLAAPSVR